MNAYEYLKQGAIVPVTMDAIRDLVELGKQQADRIAELEKQGFTFTDGGKFIPPKDYVAQAQTKLLSDEEIVQLKAEIAAYKKTNELLAQKIEQLEKELSK